MASLKMEKYKLLKNQDSLGGKDEFSSSESDHDDGYEAPHDSPRFGVHRPYLQDFWKKNALILVLVISATANLLFVVLSLVMFPRLRTQTDTRPSQSDVSLYTDIGRDPAVRFPWSTGYGPKITNHSLADERWEALNINAGIVALPDKWATEHNLPPTQRFPWDPTKGVYTLSAFHTLHCLKNIHRLLYDAHHGRPLSRDIGHAIHCVDHIRKDAMCNADDFLLPTPPNHYGMEGPKGQARVCRDWDTFLAWADQNNACYQHITDDEEAFAANHKEIERYRNCPQGSPYLKTMQEYFKSQ